MGNNKTWLDRAHRVILEVNSWQNPVLDGMHDIYYGTALPPHRVPIPLVRPDDRIGETSFRCDPDKILAIVETVAPDRNAPFAAPDELALTIAGHLIEFLTHEAGEGRLPPPLLPLQSGVCNIANAVLAGLLDSDRTACQPCRSYHAGRAGDRHRAGPRRPGRAESTAARRTGDRAMRPSSEYRPALRDYYTRARAGSCGQ